MKKIISLFLVFLLPTVAQALPLTDNLVFTVPPGNVSCVSITLPDDLGVFTDQKINYTLESSASSEWDDLTTANFGTDDNNTVIVPICFFGQANETACTGPFTVTATAPALAFTKTYTLQVCSSTIGDVDIGTPQEPNDPLGNNDLFAIGFLDSHPTAQLGTSHSLEFRLESFAEQAFDLSITSAIDASLQTTRVTTDLFNPLVSIPVTVTAPATEGDYSITVTATMTECTGTSCTKQTTATLHVSEQQQLPPTFTMSLFPQSLDVPIEQPAEFSLQLKNGQTPLTVAIKLVEFPGLTYSMTEQNVTLGTGEFVSVPFTITPHDPNAFYGITAIGTSGDVVKKASAALTTDELVSDIQHQLALLQADPNLSADQKEQANEIADAWYTSYENAQYGSNLDQYGAVQNQLASLENETTEKLPVDQQHVIPAEEPGKGASNIIFSFVITFIVPIAVILLIVVVFVLRKKSPKDTPLDELA
ncbi:MAG: hypothetical protein KKA90_03640 [Nanoarchaeota archaeon]|nr:hypothetical protein [Nanoarchaeota archaeon]